jgi:hypothetical protein
VDEPEDVTAEWLTAALNSAGHSGVVRDVTFERIGTGQIGRSYRLSLDVAPGDALPATLVLKIAAGDPEARQLVNRGFEKEVRFYQDIRAHTSVNTPRCWFAAISDDLNSFVLLLDDLAPKVPGRQADGCSYAQATAAVVNLAGLHGPLWGAALLNEHARWLAPHDAAGAEFLDALMGGATEQFVGLYRDRLSAQDQQTLMEAAKAIAPWSAMKRERFTLVHGDYRLDNLMFDPDGASVSAVDWQTTSSGSPTYDVAYFLETSLLTEDRRRHERELLTAYVEALASCGVDYPLDEAEADYRLDVLHGPLITVLGRVYATAAPTPEADEMFLAMATRSCAAIRDLDTLSAISS